MRGIFVIAPNEMDILELPEPDLGPYDALVEVQACGICNSTDWKIAEGDFQRGTYPVLFGHESVGRIVEVGEKVRSFKVGDTVLRVRLEDEHIPYDGGRSRWSGFVEKGLVTDHWAEKGVQYGGALNRQQLVPESIDPFQAVAMITLKENISCLKRTEVGEGHSLAIVGTGPVAQSLAFLAALEGIKPVVVFGRRDRWAELFERLGADAYVAGEDYPPEVRQILGGGGFDRAIEAVGSREALSRCLEVLKADGRVNLYGVTPESAPYDKTEESDPRVFRAPVVEAEAHDELLELIDQGKVDLAEWISDVIPWREYRKGFDWVREKKSNKAVKVVLDFTVG